MIYKLVSMVSFMDKKNSSNIQRTAHQTRFSKCMNDLECWSQMQFFTFMELSINIFFLIYFKLKFSTRINDHRLLWRQLMFTNLTLLFINQWWYTFTFINKKKFLSHKNNLKSFNISKFFLSIWRSIKTNYSVNHQ